MREIDLRYVQTSCTSHPVIVLANTLTKLSKEGVSEFKIYFNADDFPENALRFFLSRYSYCIEEQSPLDSKSRVAIVRKCRGE